MAHVALAEELVDGAPRAAWLRVCAAAVIALDAVLLLGVGASSPSGVTASWVADIASGLTLVTFALGLLEGARRGNGASAWALLCALGELAAPLSEGRTFDALLRAPGALALLALASGEVGSVLVLGALLLASAQGAALALEARAYFTGRDALGESRCALDHRARGEPIETLTGSSAAYALALPEGRWLDEVPPADAAWPFDRAVVAPALQAEVRVRTQYLPGASHLDLDALVERAERRHGNAERIDQEPITGAFDGARLVHLRDVRGGHRREWLVGVFVRADEVFEVTATAPAAGFGALEPAFRASVRSLAYEPPGRPALDPFVLDRVKRATALVRTEGSAGSGVLVAADATGAYVATNAHVVLGDDGERPEHVRVAFPAAGDEEMRPAELVLADVGDDVALLRLESVPSLPLPLRASDALAEHVPAFAVGFPLGPRLISGLPLPLPSVSAGRLLGLEAGRRTLDLGLNPGNSGGPVVAADGSVLGLAQASVPTSESSVMVRSETLRRAVDSPATLRWLEGPLGEPVAPVEAMEGRSAAEAALVAIDVGGERSTGVLVPSPDSEARVLVRAEVVEALDADTSITATLHVGTSREVKLGAEVIALDGASTLALLRLEPSEVTPAPRPLGALAPLGETAPIRMLGFRVRSAPWAPREPLVPIWRGGVVSSLQPGVRDRPPTALADVGINPDFIGGPVFDSAGALVGFVTQDGDPTNLTRVAPAEAIAARFELGRAGPPGG